MELTILFSQPEVRHLPHQSLAHALLFSWCGADHSVGGELHWQPSSEFLLGLPWSEFVGSCWDMKIRWERQNHLIFICKFVFPAHYFQHTVKANHRRSRELYSTTTVHCTCSMYHCIVRDCPMKCKSARGLTQHINAFHRQQSPSSSTHEPSHEPSTRLTHHSLTGKYFLFQQTYLTSKIFSSSLW